MIYVFRATLGLFEREADEREMAAFSKHEFRLKSKLHADESLTELEEDVVRLLSDYGAVLNSSFDKKKILLPGDPWKGLYIGESIAVRIWQKVYYPTQTSKILTFPRFLEETYKWVGQHNIVKAYHSSQLGNLRIPKVQHMLFLEARSNTKERISIFEVSLNQVMECIPPEKRSNLRNLKWLNR